MHDLELSEYRTLAEFRYQLACFLRRRAEAGRAVGIEPTQYQLMLAIKGLPSGQQPTITAIAQRLQIAHHTAIAIIAKLEFRGLLHRQRDANDRRVVLVSLTPRGERTLERLVIYSFKELRSEGPALLRSLTSVLR
ncbi:MAG TPA: MarR family transcriptional regulator [Terriglobales bacterium]|nr:MarR family transcriptional regulator [Terriglobales bacterium]